MRILKVDRGTKTEREDVLNIRVKFPLRKRTLNYASYFAEVGLINIRDCHTRFSAAGNKPAYPDARDFAETRD